MAKAATAAAAGLVVPGLWSLDVSHNWVSDEGGKALARALCRDRCLTECDLSDNELGDGAGRLLLSAMHRNLTLLTLTLHDNPDLPEARAAMLEGHMDARNFVHHQQGDALLSSAHAQQQQQQQQQLQPLAAAQAISSPSSKTVGGRDRDSSGTAADEDDPVFAEHLRVFVAAVKSRMGTLAKARSILPGGGGGSASSVGATAAPYRKAARSARSTAVGSRGAPPTVVDVTKLPLPPRKKGGGNITFL